jgi:hypothetical protein
MRGSLCKLAIVVVLATGLLHAQQVDDRSGGRTQPKPVTPGQTDQSQPQTPSGAPAVPSQTSAPRSEMDPTDLQIQIQQAFSQDPTLANDNLGAYVSTDAVSLAGTVASRADKDRAQAIAESMANGRTVVNDIEVDSSPNYIPHPGTPTCPSDTSTSPSPACSSSSDTFILPSGTSTSPADTSTAHHKTRPPR